VTNNDRGCDARTADSNPHLKERGKRRLEELWREPHQPNLVVEIGGQSVDYREILKAVLMVRRTRPITGRASSGRKPR
jgi:hypothetical protein